MSPSKLASYAQTLSAWLKSEASRSRKQRRTSSRGSLTWRRWATQGSYNRAAAFARACRARRHETPRTTGRGTFVPLAFGSGDAFQFDWSEDAPSCR